MKEQSSRDSGSTTAIFRRALEPCTAQSFAIQENYDHSVIWYDSGLVSVISLHLRCFIRAMGNTDALNYHGPDRRGTAKIVFRQVDEPFKAGETDLTQHNVSHSHREVFPK